MGEKLAYYWDLLVTLCTTGQVANITWLDALLVLGALASVIWALYRAIECFIRPGESSPDHIKRQILKL
jgi:hypothetical protein